MRPERRLAELEHKRLNFDLDRREEFKAENGWRIDEVRQPLPPEPPGPPLPHGSWEAARRLARNYDFAEPSIVRATFDRDAPLEHRNMLLELRFYGLRFHVGQGQMDWQIWKWLDSGEVEFRIQAFSKQASGGNPIVRLGFRLFGRREQLKFLA